jgi:hypothetical protein
MSSSNATRMIEQRRIAEQKYSRMESSLANEKRSRDIANFEVVTTKKIEKRTKQERFNRLRRDNDIALLARRQELADLYNDEITQWKNEMYQMTETQEDRKARIMERAYELRDARETARQKLVEEAYNLQWRDSCDDARTLDSKTLDKYMNEERLRQIEEKKKRNELLSANENEWLKDWNRQLDEMNARDQAKNDFRHQKQNEMVAGLKEQMEFNSSRKRNEFLSTRADDNAEIALIRKQLADERALQAQRQEEARLAGQEVLRFNAEARAVAAEESKKGAVEDAILLDYALRKEREQIAAEEAKRQGAKQAAAVYRKYLEEQMVKEAEDNAGLDEIRKREEMKVWKARDDALEARRVARENLMKLVDAGRQEQILYKRREMEEERVEGEKFAQSFVEDAKIGMAREREAIEKRRQVAEQNNEVLLRQIATRQRRSEAEKQETYLEDKQMQYMEKLHKQKLQEQAGSVRLNFPLTKNSWYT